jgi:hypothetical protein
MQAFPAKSKEINGNNCVFLKKARSGDYRAEQGQQFTALRIAFCRKNGCVKRRMYGRIKQIISNSKEKLE